MVAWSEARRNLQHPSLEWRTDRQGKETSTIHLFHNWRTLINGNWQREESTVRTVVQVPSTKAKGDCRAAEKLQLKAD